MLGELHLIIKILGIEGLQSTIQGQTPPAMARYTITPWKHTSDLLTVRQQLYRLADDASMQAPDDRRRHAVDRVMAWKLRSNLPHAVESTALLIDAQLHHQNATINAPHGLEISEFSIRAVYAAAFTRFVTGFCDIGRAREKGLEQSSMLAIARQIGMPPEFVALRHEATHEELPGLKRLIAAVEKGLQWLWRVYWARLAETGDAGGKVSADDVRGEVLGLLKLFRRDKRDALRNRAKDGNVLIQRTLDGCLAVCDSKRSATDLIADVLVKERLLLPANRSMGESMDGAYLIWDDILAMLHSRLPSFGGSLIETLLGTITALDDARPQGDAKKEANALWVLHITQTVGQKQVDNAMQYCCLHPGHWTQLLGQWLLESGDEAFVETWRDILAAGRLGEPENHAEAEHVMSDQMEVDAADEMTAKWSRAVLPPSVPIGVVR